MNGRLVNLGSGQQGRTFAISSARAGQADTLRSPQAPTDTSAKAKTDSTTHRPDLLTRAFKALDRSLPLPDNARSYTYLLLALLIVTSGMMVQLVLSAKTLQSKVELADKQNRHTSIERDNGEILWRIGRETNLRNVEARALQSGYKSIDEREYIDANGNIVNEAPEPSSLRSMLKERAEQSAEAVAIAEADAALDELGASEYAAMHTETAAGEGKDSVTALLAIMFIKQLEEWAGTFGHEIDTVADSMTDSVSRSVNDSIELEELTRNAVNWRSDRLVQPIQGTIERIQRWVDGVLDH